MLDQRITVPSKGMVFGESTEQMIFNATEQLPPALRASYEPVLVLASPVGYKQRLQPAWKIGQRHAKFNWRHYGKVVFTLSAAARQNAKMEEAFQMSLDLEEENHV